MIAGYVKSLMPGLPGRAPLALVCLISAALSAGTPATAQEFRDPIFDPNIVDSEESLGEPDLRPGAIDETAPLPRGPEENGVEREDEGAPNPFEVEDFLRTDTEADAIIAQARRFQDEDGTEPATRSRHPAQESVEELYSPLGVRRGAFLFFPTLEVAGIFTDNVFQTGINPQSDHGLDLHGGVRMRSDWTRHEFSLEVTGQRQFLNRFTKEAEKTFRAEVAGRLDVSSRTQFSGRLYHDFDTEGRSSQQLPADAAERTNIRTDGFDLDLSHRFNRLTLALRGGATRYDHDDVRLNDGSLANNDDRDFTERLLGLRASFELSPRLTVFADGAVNRRDHRQRVDDDGFRRGSDGHEATTGVELAYSDKLRGRLALGYGHQTPDDLRLEAVKGPIFDAGLEYRITALTTINLNAATVLDDSILAGSAGAVRRQFELELTHALRRHWIVLLGLGYGTVDYKGIDLEQDRFSAKVGTDYYFNRNAALTVLYEFESNDGPDQEDKYTVNRVHVGMKLRR